MSVETLDNFAGDFDWRDRAAVRIMALLCEHEPDAVVRVMGGLHRRAEDFDPRLPASERARLAASYSAESLKVIGEAWQRIAAKIGAEGIADVGLFFEPEPADSTADRILTQSPVPDTVPDLMTRAYLADTQQRFEGEQ